MAETHNEITDGPEPFAPRTYFATLPTWKRMLIAGAVIMLVAAAVSLLVEDPKPRPKPGEMSSLNAGNESADPAAATWSEAFFKFGFSFFLGFTIGYACRAFLKFLFFLVGGMAVVLFVLNYYGFVTVEWIKMEQAFDHFGQALQGQLGEFRTFITGSLPNAGLAGLGLFAGFKKNG